MLHLPQELHDGELFRELPDLTRTPGSEGRGLNWDGSFADAYIKRLQHLRPEADDFTGGGADGVPPAVEAKRRECFLALEQFVLGYLEQGQPVRRMPSSRQTFWRGENGTVELDYFSEMDRAPGNKADCTDLDKYLRELEQQGEVLRWYRSYLRHRSNFWRALLRFVPAVVLLAAAGWVFYLRLAEPLSSLLILLLTLLGVLFLTLWSGVLSYRAVLLHYRQFLERDGRLLEYYRYARFCQLWCSVEGRQTPAAIRAGLAEINQAIDRYRRITQFYPDLG